ncbi:MAG: SWIM zinc finger family protein [Acidobacteriota bacterium]
MAKAKLPKLTEAQLRALATAKVFARGKDYYDQGLISATALEGMSLRGECQGSDPEPYAVRITLDKNGVVDSDCDCPYEYEGVCKHAVALLLAYVYEPQNFQVASSTTSELADRSKAELIALINELTGKDPKLKAVVAINTATHRAKQGKPLDTAAIRKQARRVLKIDEWDYRRARTIAKELRALDKVGEELRRAKDFQNAGAVYYALLDEIVNAYDDLLWQVDENGDVMAVVDDFAKALGDCLKQSGLKNAARRNWWQCLLAVFLKDHELGGVDFGASAEAIILEQTTDDEWQWIAETVRDKASRSRDWEQGSLIDFIAEGLKRRKRQGEVTALIREAGTPEQQASLLIREKNFKEALRRINDIVKDKPGLVESFADELVDAGARQAAVEFVQARAAKGNWRSNDWLAAYYRKFGSAEEAVKWQQKSFFDSPTVERFKILEEVCRKTENWQAVRGEALATLERGKQFAALMEIALYEKDTRRAIELLPQIKSYGWRDYGREVAKAAEQDYPQEAIRIYRQKAETAIEERNRASYHLAAEYLKRAQQLSLQLDEDVEWSDYIGTLRQMYKHLPALQDELRKAGV